MIVPQIPHLGMLARLSKKIVIQFSLPRQYWWARNCFLLTHLVAADIIMFLSAKSSFKGCSGRSKHLSHPVSMSLNNTMELGLCKLFIPSTPPQQLLVLVRPSGSRAVCPSDSNKNEGFSAKWGSHHSSSACPLVS